MPRSLPDTDYGPDLAEGRNGIAIVEDEALVRFGLVEVFDNAGWRVIQARDTDEALGLPQAHGAVDAVVSDVGMPGAMDGIRLAHAVRQESARHRALPANADVLAKPFDYQQLLARIEGALG